MCRFSAAFVLALWASCPILAQYHSVSLCLVQTKPYASAPYDPPAGPWATEMYDLLSARKLKNGAALNITVLAAQIEEAVPSEVRRLRCPYVVQLRDHRSLWNAGRPPLGGTESVLFTLWRGDTGQAIIDGASLIPGDRHATKAAFTATCADLAEQILKGLNKLP